MWRMESLTYRHRSIMVFTGPEICLCAQQFLCGFFAHLHGGPLRQPHIYQRPSRGLAPPSAPFQRESPASSRPERLCFRAAKIRCFTVRNDRPQRRFSHMRTNPRSRSPNGARRGGSIQALPPPTRMFAASPTTSGRSVRSPRARSCPMVLAPGVDQRQPV